MFLLTLACAPQDEEDGESGPRPTDEDTAGGYGAEGRGCAYTSTAVGEREPADAVGGTPDEIAAAFAGSRVESLTWLEDEATTELVHELVLDATSALWWEGELTDEEDGEEALARSEEEESESGGDIDSGGGGTGFDTGDKGSGERCPSYLTLSATWSFATADGAFDESLPASVRVDAMDAASASAELAWAELAGAWVPSDEALLDMDEFDVQFGAELGTSTSTGAIEYFASRVDGEVAMATMGDVASW
jgi:hypothetical protein